MNRRVAFLLLELRHWLSISRQDQTDNARTYWNRAKFARNFNGIWPFGGALRDIVVADSYCEFTVRLWQLFSKVTIIPACGHHQIRLAARTVQYPGDLARADIRDVSKTSWP